MANYSYMLGGNDPNARRNRLAINNPQMLRPNERNARQANVLSALTAGNEGQYGDSQGYQQQPQQRPNNGYTWEGTQYGPWNAMPYYNQQTPWGGVADSINGAWGGGGGNPTYYAAPVQQQGYSVNARQQQQFNPVDYATAGAIWNAQLPWNQIGSQINNAFDQYQYYADKAADRELKASLINNLLGGINTGGRMRGFVDLNSGQAASLPGQTTNAITAQALSPQAISQAAQMAGAAKSAPAAQAANPLTKGQQGEVNQIAQDAARNRGMGNANDIERNLTAENSNLQRAIELAKSKQGLGNAGWLTNLNQDNAQYNVAMQAPILRALIGSLGNLV